MNTRQPPQSHRFVVVYRNEHREIEGAADIWRGWVERIPNPRQRELERQREDRLDFRNLSDLPHLIEMLIRRSETDLDLSSNRRPRP